MDIESFNYQLNSNIAAHKIDGFLISSATISVYSALICIFFNGSGRRTRQSEVTNQNRKFMIIPPTIDYNLHDMIFSNDRVKKMEYTLT